MQSSVYNNPAFAQGLSGLVNSFIGDPVKTAQAEVYASEALLNRQTAQYREAMDVGLDGDIASMMIRALQAGPDYSRYAPSIGQAWYDATSGRMARGPVSGARGGRASSGGEKDPTPEELDFRTRQMILDGLGDDVDMGTKAGILADVEGLLAQGMSVNEAAAYALDPENLQRGEGTPEVKGFFGIGRQEAQPGPITGLVPYVPSGAGNTGTAGETVVSPQGGGERAAAIAEARARIAAGRISPDRAYAALRGVFPDLDISELQ